MPSAVVYPEGEGAVVRMAEPIRAPARDRAPRFMWAISSWAAVLFQNKTATLLISPYGFGIMETKENPFPERNAV